MLTRDELLALGVPEDQISVAIKKIAGAKVELLKGYKKNEDYEKLEGELEEAKAKLPKEGEENVLAEKDAKIADLEEELSTLKLSHSREKLLAKQETKLKDDVFELAVEQLAKVEIKKDKDGNYDEEDFNAKYKELVERFPSFVATEEKPKSFMLKGDEPKDGSKVKEPKDMADEIIGDLLKDL